MMAELEEEMDRAEFLDQVLSPGAGSAMSQSGESRGHGSTPPTRPGKGAILPAGAVPSQNGVLTPQAAEFWFPESRNCECCQGYKHGCSCRANGKSTCVVCSPNEAEFEAYTLYDKVKHY